MHACTMSLKCDIFEMHLDHSFKILCLFAYLLSCINFPWFQFMIFMYIMFNLSIGTLVLDPGW